MRARMQPARRLVSRPQTSARCCQIILRIAHAKKRVIADSLSGAEEREHRPAIATPVIKPTILAPHASETPPRGPTIQSNDSTATCTRLSVRDGNSGLVFLIDTGAEVSLVPRRQNATPAHRKLYAANGTPITTFGTQRLELSLNLRRTFSWTFIIADVTDAILGADFLRHHNLLDDLNGRRLMDGATLLETHTSTKSTAIHAITTHAAPEPFASIIKKYSSIVQVADNQLVA